MRSVTAASALTVAQASSEPPSPPRKPRVMVGAEEALEAGVLAGPRERDPLRPASRPPGLRSSATRARRQTSTAAGAVASPHARPPHTTPWRAIGPARGGRWREERWEWPSRGVSNAPAPPATAAAPRAPPGRAIRVAGPVRRPPPAARTGHRRPDRRRNRRQSPGHRDRRAGSAEGRGSRGTGAHGCHRASRRCP